MTSVMSIQANVLKNSMYLFLNGTGGSCQIELGANQVMCLPQEICSMTLMNLSVNLTKYFIDTTNNSFALNGTTYSVTPGTYTYNQIALTINALVNGATTAAQITAFINNALAQGGTPYTTVVSYNPNTNRFDFTFATFTTITFVNNSSNTLGFNPTDTPSGLTFSSSKVLDAWNQVKCVFLRVRGVSHFLNGNISNFDGANLLTTGVPETEITDILSMIPISQTSPFTTLHYTNSGSTYEMYFNENQVNNLQITFTDEYGNLLSYLNDFTLGIRINTYVYDNSTEKQLNEISKITSLLKMMFLSYALNRKNKT